MAFWTRFFKCKQKEQELEDEINAHLAMEEQQRIERGESPQQAKANARRDFGNVLQVKEMTRDAWGWRWVERLQQDLRYSIRILLQNRGFALVTIVSLGLGIGANTALFSLADRLLIQSLPVKDPEHLVEVQRGVTAFNFFKPLVFTPDEFEFGGETIPFSPTSSFFTISTGLLLRLAVRRNHP